MRANVVLLYFSCDCVGTQSKFGFDHAIDYKATDGSAEALAAKIRECCPDGIDMYFDNVRLRVGPSSGRCASRLCRSGLTNRLAQ